jgi:hypothetical protein
LRRTLLSSDIIRPPRALHLILFFHRERRSIFSQEARLNFLTGDEVNFFYGERGSIFSQEARFNILTGNEVNFFYGERGSILAREARFIKDFFNLPNLDLAVNIQPFLVSPDEFTGKFVVILSANFDVRSPSLDAFFLRVDDVRSSY